MAFPIALIPVALSAIQSLVKFRDRVDVILSLHKASEPLPLLLPPPPPDYGPYAQPMRDFFQSPSGVQLLSLHNRKGAFAKVLADPDNAEDDLFHERRKLYDLYFAANNIQPELEEPDDSNTTVSASDPRLRPDGQLQLAAYVVESHRLSRNPTVTRILLATADTVLEVAGANAGLFISNPKTRSVVESVLQDFAGEQDFDDESSDRIFKRLLSATVVAALDTPGIIPEQPVLKPFLRALADVRTQLPDGDDFVARLITMQGFEQMISSFLGHVAEDPSFIAKDELAKKVISATLAEVAKNVPDLSNDPKAFIGVLEAGLKAGAADVGGVLERELAGKPLIAALLKSVAKSVAQSPAPFQQLVKGDLFAAVYKTALEAISANPALFGDDAKTQAFAGALVAALNDAVKKNDLHALFSPERLQALLTEGVALVAAHPGMLGRGDPAVLAVIGAAFKGGATAVADGKITQRELMEIAEAAVRTAAANQRDPAFAGKLSEVLRVAGTVLGDAQVAALIAADTRKELLVSIIEAAAANPRVWGPWADGQQLQPLLEAVIRTLAIDAADCLGSGNLNAAIRVSLVQIARRGSTLLDGKVTPPQVSALLALALKAADQQIGVTLDRESVLPFFDAILGGFLRQPFQPTTIGAPEFQALLSAALATVDTT